MIKKQAGTCIAVLTGSKGKILMAGERRASFGDYYNSSPKPKIKKRDGFLIGACGNGFLCELMTETFPFPEKETMDINLTTYMICKLVPQVQSILSELKIFDHPKQINPLDGSLMVLPPEYDTGVLLVHKHRIFLLNIDSTGISVDEVTAPFAIGCGGEYAMGSLMTTADIPEYQDKPAQRIRLAVEVAAKCSSGCDSEVDDISE